MKINLKKLPTGTYVRVFFKNNSNESERIYKYLKHVPGSIVVNKYDYCFEPFGDGGNIWLNEDGMWGSRNYYFKIIEVLNENDYPEYYI